MSKIALATAVLLGLAAGGAAAQTTPPATRDAPANPAVNSTGPNNPGAPAPGANSFTETQARARLEDQGYTAVSGLTKDKDGIWRGSAMRNGQKVEVALDYQGNIVAR
ncbi:PepSY domain-containing protein [Stella sp.]|uniref:PepSY domain-containing protein n=1 Tax=Stella sp. TaxID=2912054 RepID=UPI0035AE659D